MASKKLPLFAIFFVGFSSLCSQIHAMNWFLLEASPTCWDQLKEIKDEVDQEVTLNKEKHQKFILACARATFDQKDAIKTMFYELNKAQQKQLNSMYKCTFWTLNNKQFNYQKTVTYKKKLQEIVLEHQNPHYKDRKKLKKALKILKSMDESHASYADMVKLVQLLALKCQSSQSLYPTQKIIQQLDYNIISQEEQELDWNEIINKATTFVSWANKFKQPMIYAAKAALKIKRRGK